ncbi:MAG: ABC transporter permease [Anaerolineae bacterium]
MSALRGLLRVQQVRELSLFIILLLVLLLFSSQIENYLSPRTFDRISTTVAIITIVAVGQTIVVLTRNIDLSVGSIVGFTAYFVGQQFAFFRELNPIVSVALAMGVGALMGTLNGFLVAYGRVPAVVVTLGTLAIFRGGLVEYSGSQSIATRMLPDWIKELPQQTVFRIGDVEFGALPFIALIAVILFQLILVFTAFGRRLYAAGSSPEAAEVAGIPARRLIFTAFIISGALAGLGGFVYLSRYGTITATAATGLELQVVAAVVVGGVNTNGGSGTVLGALLGAVLVGTIEQSLIRMRINEFWKDALLGVFILIAVTSDSVMMNRLRTWWAGRGQRNLTSTPRAGKGEA